MRMRCATGTLLLTLLCLAVHLPGSSAAGSSSSWPNPCKPTAKPSSTFSSLSRILYCLGGAARNSSAPCPPLTTPYKTTIDSLQGVWSGSCRRLVSSVPPSGSTPPGSYRCSPTPHSYDVTIAYNGTRVGFNLSGTIEPIGSSRVTAVSPVDSTSLLTLLNVSMHPGVYSQGVAHLTVSCVKGRPTYTELDVHLLATGNVPSLFPVPQKRDSELWCNDRDEIVDEHAPRSFNIICSYIRVGDLGPTWP